MLGSAYPRVREKACSRQVGRQGCRFIPTHGRGERRRSGSLLRWRHCFGRSIPVCVDGEGVCRCRRRERHRVYPRAWADWAWRSLIGRLKGPVYAQGGFGSASLVQLRFIPACVGESPRSSSTDLSLHAGGWSRVCPCACGGKLENCYQRSIARGSSLRANRGVGDVQDAIVRDGLSPCAQGRDASCARSILLCVEVGRWIAGRCQAVYPRVCGREGAAAADCTQSG